MRLFLAVIRSPVANATGGIPRLRSTDPGGDETAIFRTVQSFHKKPSTQPRSIVPPICSSFRVNVAENQ